MLMGAEKTHPGEVQGHGAGEVGDIASGGGCFVRTRLSNESGGGSGAADLKYSRRGAGSQKNRPRVATVRAPVCPEASACRAIARSTIAPLYRDGCCRLPRMEVIVPIPTEEFRWHRPCRLRHPYACRSQQQRATGDAGPLPE